MDCIIIIIGNEILSGKTIDSNSSYISQKLSSIGINTRRIITIGDKKEEIDTAVREALKLAGFVITTGGLGPTRDDITKKTISEIFNKKLKLDKELLHRVEDRFKSFGYKKMPDINISQAEVPEGAITFPNKKGTAPGILIREGNKFCAMLPGVPYEMEGLLNEFIIPYLEKNAEAGNFIITRTIRTTGIGESSLAEMLEPSLKESSGVEIAYLPGFTGVDIRLTVRGNDKELLNKKIEDIEKNISEKAKRFIYGYEDTDLANVVFNMLKEKEYRLSVAESCTGGLICHRLTNIPGSSSVFERGVVTYSSKAKKEVLGIPDDIIKNFGTVSKETALRMAENVRKISGSDIGISTTGIAGPDRDEFNNPVGLVYVGYSDKSGKDFKELRIGEGRIKVKERAAQAAFNLLRIKLYG